MLCYAETDAKLASAHTKALDSDWQVFGVSEFQNHCPNSEAVAYILTAQVTKRDWLFQFLLSLSLESMVITIVPMVVQIQVAKHALLFTLFLFFEMYALYSHDAMHVLYTIQF